MKVLILLHLLILTSFSYAMSFEYTIVSFILITPINLSQNLLPLKTSPIIFTTLPVAIRNVREAKHVLKLDLQKNRI